MVDVALALVGVGVGLARGGFERRMARAFTLWMFFRALLSVWLYVLALRDASSFVIAFDMWTYTVIALDFAFVAWVLSFPRARSPPWSMWLLLALGVAYEAAYFANHCLVFCVKPGGLLTGPLDFPEIFSLLYALAGWVFARDMDDARNDPRVMAWLAATFVLLGGYYSTVGIVDWLHLGYPATHDPYVDSPWFTLIVATQWSPALGAVPACVALARRLANPWRWALVAGFVAMAAIGVWQNFMSPLAADSTATVLVALPLAGAIGAVARQAKAAPDARVPG
jgi:hypothetical protein